MIEQVMISGIMAWHGMSLWQYRNPHTAPVGVKHLECSKEDGKNKTVDCSVCWRGKNDTVTCTTIDPDKYVEVFKSDKSSKERKTDGE